jgi:hypothetical protein
VEAHQQRKAMQENARYEFGDSDYTHAKAYSLAIAAKLSYENTDIIRCEVAKWGFPNFQVYRYARAPRRSTSGDVVPTLAHRRLAPQVSLHQGLPGEQRRHGPSSVLRYAAAQPQEPHHRSPGQPHSCRRARYAVTPSRHVHSALFMLTLTLSPPKATYMPGS